VPDGLSVDGTPLASLGRVEQVWEGVLGQDYLDVTPDPIGETIPDWVPLAIPRPFTVGMLIFGTDRAEFMQRWAALVALGDHPDEQLTLTREVDFGGTVITVERPAKFLGGHDPTMLDERHGRVALRFQPLANWAAP
jgi:hypothetical protein